MVKGKTGIINTPPRHNQDYETLLWMYLNFS